MNIYTPLECCALLYTPAVKCNPLLLESVTSIEPTLVIHTIHILLLWKKNTVWCIWRPGRCRVRNNTMFVWCSVEGMSDEELQEKALGGARHTLSGKSNLERAAVLHQHIGRRAMGDMVIETFEPSPGENVHLFNCTLKRLANCWPAVYKFHKYLQYLFVHTN